MPDLGHKKMGFLLASIATIFKHISWLVAERIHNRVSEPLLCPKNGIVKIYGPSVYCEICFNMVCRETLLMYINRYRSNTAGAMGTGGFDPHSQVR